MTAKLISAFVFGTRTVQFLFYLNRKFQASSSFLCLYRPVCVGPGQKPHCWFSHEATHLCVCLFVCWFSNFSKILQPASQLVKAMQNHLLRNPYFSSWQKECIESKCLYVSIGRTGDSVRKWYTFNYITVRRQRTLPNETAHIDPQQILMTRYV